MRPALFFLHDDARILDLIRRGDEEALVTLYHANKRAVSAYVSRNSGTQDDAEDMLQEALVTLWERVRSGRFTYSAQLSTFIFATVKNMWLRRLAHHRKETPMDIDEDASANGDPSPLDSLIESERTMLVRDALEKLGEPCRQLLLLFYWEERSMNEIARVMGFANADTVKSKKYQCKKALEKLIYQYR